VLGWFGSWLNSAPASQLVGHDVPGDAVKPRDERRPGVTVAFDPGPGTKEGLRHHVLCSRPKMEPSHSKERRVARAIELAEGITVPPLGAFHEQGNPVRRAWVDDMASRLYIGVTDRNVRGDPRFHGDQPTFGSCS
jgi:hypothetical protein